VNKDENFTNTRFYPEIFRVQEESEQDNQLETEDQKDGTQEMGNG
jgi:hypothetical protein